MTDFMKELCKFSRKQINETIENNELSKQKKFRVVYRIFPKKDARNRHQSE